MLGLRQRVRDLCAQPYLREDRVREGTDRGCVGRRVLSGLDKSEEAAYEFALIMNIADGLAWAADKS